MFSRLIFSAVSLDIDVYFHELLLFLVTNYFFFPLKNFRFSFPISIWGHFRVTYKIRPKLGFRPKFLKAQINVEWDTYRGDVKSLARPGRKQARKHFRDRANSTTSRRELSSSVYFANQGAEGNSRHSDRNSNLFPFCSD